MAGAQGSGARLLVVIGPPGFGTALITMTPGLPAPRLTVLALLAL